MTTQRRNGVERTQAENRQRRAERLVFAYRKYLANRGLDLTAEVIDGFADLDTEGRRTVEALANEVHNRKINPPGVPSDETWTIAVGMLRTALYTED